MGSLAIDDRKYARVLAKILPRVITNDEEHERMLAEVEKLMDKGAQRTPEQDAALELRGAARAAGAADDRYRNGIAAFIQKDEIRATGPGARPDLAALRGPVEEIRGVIRGAAARVAVIVVVGHAGFGDDLDLQGQGDGLAGVIGERAGRRAQQRRRKIDSEPHGRSFPPGVWTHSVTPWFLAARSNRRAPETD